MVVRPPKTAPGILPSGVTRYTHRSEPDYTQPLLQVTPAHRDCIMDKLKVLYGEDRAHAYYPEIERLMRVYHAYKTEAMLEAEQDFNPVRRFTERDIVLITYGDLITSDSKTPLAALRDFVSVFMRGTINTIHLLPFFPYSSDRGFSIIDYEEVDPRLGTWEDIAQLGGHFRLMFDGVFNHASSKSRWFQRFLNGRPGYENFFIAFNTRDAIDPDYLRLILRPRTSDLLTPFHTIHGVRYVWTTFSPDQIDLNFKDENVLFRVVEILLAYVRRGADIIRLDAVTYIWRELGTSCAHLRQTHALVQLMRAILDAVAPDVALITETNVPHEDNISYFGDGTNESQLVYNFALPPLVLHTFHAGNCDRLAEWAESLRPPSEQTSFFNFLASHDGIGLLGAQGLLSRDEINALVARTQEHGGLVSFRSDGQGGRSPYELNITWFSVLNRENSGETLDRQVDRYIAARSIALVLQGVPGIYLPSLFGAVNDREAISSGAEARSINRRAIDETILLRQLGEIGSRARRVAIRFRRLIRRRVGHAAFHPCGSQKVLRPGSGVFAVLRTSPDGTEQILALTNVTAAAQSITIDEVDLGPVAAEWRDLLSRRRARPENGIIHISLPPYGVTWFLRTNG